MKTKTVVAVLALGLSLPAFAVFETQGYKEGEPYGMCSSDVTYLPIGILTMSECALMNGELVRARMKAREAERLKKVEEDNERLKAKRSEEQKTTAPAPVLKSPAASNANAKGKKKPATKEAQPLAEAQESKVESRPKQ